MVVSTAGLAVDAASALSAGVVSTAAGALVSIAVEAFVSTPVTPAPDVSVPSGAEAGGVATADDAILAGGVGAFWKEEGSTPTALDTTGVESVVLADGPPPNAVGSTPTELETIGGGAVDGGVGDDAPGRIDAD